jgi:hypothetical protein
MWKLVVLTLFLSPGVVVPPAPPVPSVFVQPLEMSGFQTAELCNSAKTAIMASPLAVAYPTGINVLCVQAARVYTGQ